MLTEEPTEALGADACVAIDLVHTLGSMATLVSHTVIVVCLTQLSTVARDTFAPESFVQGDALGLVLTEVHLGHTVVNHLITQLPCVVRRAQACVDVDPIHTGGTVFTVVILTVIWVDLTSLSLKAQRAGAAESISEVLTEVAGASVLTGVLDAGVDGYGAVLALVAVGAGAAVLLHGILTASAVVLARAREAGVALGHDVNVHWPFALEPVSGGGEQESVCHGLGAAASGNARLLVSSLYPL